MKNLSNLEVSVMLQPPARESGPATIIFHQIWGSGSWNGDVLLTEVRRNEKAYIDNEDFAPRNEVVMRFWVGARSFFRDLCNPLEA